MAKRLRSNSGTLMVCRVGWKYFLVSFSDCFLVKNTREFLHENLRLFGLLLAPSCNKVSFNWPSTRPHFSPLGAFLFPFIGKQFFCLLKCFFHRARKKWKTTKHVVASAWLFFCESRESWAMLLDSVRLWMETDFERRGKNRYLNVH